VVIVLPVLFLTLESLLLESLIARIEESAHSRVVSVLKLIPPFTIVFKCLIGST
jgi:hypothetical protein